MPVIGYTICCDLIETARGTSGYLQYDRGALTMVHAKMPLVIFETPEKAETLYTERRKKLDSGENVVPDTFRIVSVEINTHKALGGNLRDRTG